jgi:hypothetical protein
MTTEIQPSKTPEYQFSSLRMTVWLSVSDGVIQDAAPVVRKFIGQPAANLEAWMQRQGGFRKHYLQNLNSDCKISLEDKLFRF